MHNGDGGATGRKPYKAPTLTLLGRFEVGCGTWADAENEAARELAAALSAPAEPAPVFGETPQERIASAANAIRAVLAQLPPDERDDAIFEVVGASDRWARKASWAP